MSLRPAVAALALFASLLGGLSGCGSDTSSTADSAPEVATPAPAPTSAEPTSVLPKGSGKGAVDLVIDGKTFTSDWDVSCADRGEGKVGIIAIGSMPNSVQLTVEGDKVVEGVVAVDDLLSSRDDSASWSVETRADGYDISGTAGVNKTPFTAGITCGE